MAGPSPVMLMCLPGSWGALYFRSVWRRFVEFYTVRAFPPFYNASAEAFQKGKLALREPLGDPALVIDQCRASTWPRSWKRFMIDFMYGRGDVMLYPNAPIDPSVPYASYSFSTTYMEKGDHSGTDGKVESAATDKVRPSSEHDRRKTVSLVPMTLALDTVRAMEKLPKLERAPVIELHHRRAPAGIASVIAKGRAFLRRRIPMTAATANQQRVLEQVWLRPYADPRGTERRG